MKNSWLMLAALIFLSSCKVNKEGTTSMSIKNEVERTHCIGRSLITLPSSFAASPVATGIFKLGEIGGRAGSIDVEVHDGEFSNEQFDNKVQMRRIELKNKEDGAVDNLRLDKRLDSGANLFRIQQIDNAYVSEVNMLRGSSMVTLRLESFHDKYLEAEEVLGRLIKDIHAIDINNSSKSGPGFCLGGVKITGDFSSESGSFRFRDGKGAIFGVEIDTYGLDGEPPLLMRMSGPDSLLYVFDVKHKVLRAGERIVAGMRAQEWLGWAKISDEPEAKNFKFALDTMRTKPGRLAPSISLTFDTAQPLEDGTQTKTVISDDEAMRQWDAVVDSIKSAGI